MPEAADLHTSISETFVDRVVVRDHDLCVDLIGKIGFVEYFLLLLTGRRASKPLVAATDAALVSIAEHGFVPSIQAARMTLAAEPGALQGAVAAGLLGCGSVILGAAESAGRMLIAVCTDAKSDGDFDSAAIRFLERARADKVKLPGFGHPVHRFGDPRARRLIEIANEIGVAGRHVAAMQALERNIVAYGRPMPANVSLAIPALLLDAGFPAESLKGIPLLARCASLIAHLREESETRLGFRLADAAVEKLRYLPAAP